MKNSSYNNQPASRFGGLGTHTNGVFGNLSSNDNESIGLGYLDNYNVKSPYNNQPIGMFRRLVAGLTIIMVMISGSNVLLERKPMTEEEKEALFNRAKKAVVDTIVEEGLITSQGKIQQVSYINPAPTSMVKEKQGN